ncbi:hypothetical protein MIMGU_mgv1a016734mg [Erythranthe guttata]|uniref:Uncharacterized protein n=1 Tax=Erythranthe guttata TaxID=4155 RepID=A0A022RXD4_ERYGU|nr:hypothetical protein MIMGU_mgv1a016734mg [Erythranthe guttata]
MDKVDCASFVTSDKERWEGSESCSARSRGEEVGEAAMETNIYSRNEFCGLWKLEKFFFSHLFRQERANLLFASRYQTKATMRKGHVRVLDTSSHFKIIQQFFDYFEILP